MLGFKNTQGRRAAACSWLGLCLQHWQERASMLSVASLWSQPNHHHPQLQMTQAAATKLHQSSKGCRYIWLQPCSHHALTRMDSQGLWWALA